MADKIALEVAQAEFDRWAQAMDLARKLDPSGLDNDDKKSLAEAKNAILGAMMDGNLVVNDSDEFVYTQNIADDKDKGPITFHEPDGAAIMSVDQIGKSGTHDVTKAVSVLSQMTKETKARFARMKNRAWAVCQAIFGLFFAR